MNEKVQPFYQFPFFQKLQGLPEAIVEKEEQIGQKLSGANIELVGKEFQFMDKSIWMGKVGDWYFLGFPIADGSFRYEVFESKLMIELFFMSRAKSLPSTLKGFWMREVEKIHNY